MHVSTTSLRPTVPQDLAPRCRLRCGPRRVACVNGHVRHPWPSDGQPSHHVCQHAEVEQLRNEITLLREELRLKDARMGAVRPPRRPRCSNSYLRKRPSRSSGKACIKPSRSRAPICTRLSRGTSATTRALERLDHWRLPSGGRKAVASHAPAPQSDALPLMAADGTSYWPLASICACLLPPSVGSLRRHHPRQEPGAVMPLAGICAGAYGWPRFLL